MNPRQRDILSLNKIPLTWAAFLEAARFAGVKDDDVLYSIDIGPEATKLHILRDTPGIEISDTPFVGESYATSEKPKSLVMPPNRVRNGSGRPSGGHGNP